MRAVSAALVALLVFLATKLGAQARPWLSNDASSVPELAALQGVAMSARIPDKSPVTVTASLASNGKPHVRGGAGLAAFWDVAHVDAGPNERFANVVNLVVPGAPLPATSDSIILTESSVRVSRPVRVTDSGHGHWRQAVSKPFHLPFRAERAVGLSNSTFVVVGGGNSSVGSITRLGNVVFGPSTPFCRTLSVDNRIAALTSSLVVVSFYDAPSYNLTTAAGVVVNMHAPPSRRRLVWGRKLRYARDHMYHVVARLSATSAALVYPDDVPFSASSQATEDQAAVSLVARVATIATNLSTGIASIASVSAPALLHQSDVDGPFDCTGVSAPLPALGNSSSSDRDGTPAGAATVAAARPLADASALPRGLRSSLRRSNDGATPGGPGATWSASMEAAARRPALRSASVQGAPRQALPVPSVLCAFRDLGTGSLRSVLLQQPRQRGAGPGAAGAPRFAAMATVMEHAAVGSGAPSAWRDVSVVRMSDTGAAVLFSDDENGGRAVVSLVGISTHARRPALAVSQARFDLTERNPDPRKALFWAGIAPLGNDALMLVDWASLEAAAPSPPSGSIFGARLPAAPGSGRADSAMGGSGAARTRSDSSALALGGHISVVVAGGIPAGVSVGGAAAAGEAVSVQVDGVAALAVDTTAVGSCAASIGRTAFALPDGTVVVGSSGFVSALAHLHHHSWGVPSAITDAVDGSVTEVVVAAQSALGMVTGCADGHAKVVLRPGGGFR